MQNTIDPKELEEFIKTVELPELINIEDVGKVGEITSTGFVETKYGKRLRMTIKFSDKEKNALLGRQMTDRFVQVFGIQTNEWIGKKVVVERMLTSRGNPTATVIPAVELNKVKEEKVG